jgi:hypothetical protein
MSPRKTTYIFWRPIISSGFPVHIKWHWTNQTLVCTFITFLKSCSFFYLNDNPAIITYNQLHIFLYYTVIYSIYRFHLYTKMYYSSIVNIWLLWYFYYVGIYLYVLLGARLFVHMFVLCFYFIHSFIPFTDFLFFCFESSISTRHYWLYHIFECFVNKTKNEQKKDAEKTVKSILFLVFTSLPKGNKQANKQ